ncbi:hypothetical protein [Anaerostipes butyraticus]|uniref:Uncharacterized protein n=1 Tax=Anaerostipes butyraticus TaxID=645466 RepID=A0A916Q5G2_9FIRM|nr:hypothetical protein [Anaerostipes butyraticus]GFO84763.1 hypothetical protein ANBU17_11100 [Anaerostipes butyraticus]
MRKKPIKKLAASVLLAGLALGVTGCFKPSKSSVEESEYYQDLKDDYDKVSQQLKDEKKKTSSLNKQIQSIQEASGDEKLADYKSQIKDSIIGKVDFTADSVKEKTFAVTNTPVCDYAKEIITGCNRVLGVTPDDLEDTYDDYYSYALMDEDNTTFEFKVYGDSFLVFDDIPSNVYAYNGASVLGDALIDAAVQKSYDDFADRIADADLIVTDEKLKYSTDAINASKILAGIINNKIDNANYDTDDWDEYRFYTKGTVTKVQINSDDKIICIENKGGNQTFYRISEKNLTSLEKILK